MERLLTIPTTLDDVGILEGMRYFVGCTTPSTYQLRLTVTANTIAVPAGTTDLSPYAARYTVSTLRGTTPVPNTVCDVTLSGPGIAGSAGTETWVTNLATGTEMFEVVPPQVPMTLRIHATWRAPDGLHHADATVTWTVEGSGSGTPPASGGSGGTPPASGSGNPPAGGSPALGTPLAVITGQIVNDAFLFGASCTGPGGTVPVPFILDTGAFELLLTQEIATALHLPNLGTLDLSGVGGSVQAYQSVVDLTLGNETWHAVPCVVDPTFNTNLFGLRWWIDNKLRLLLDPAAATLTVLPPASP
jgi:hypothetical protein